MVQTGRNRWIQDPNVVMHAWEAAGAEVDVCCDWNTVCDNDLNEYMCVFAHQSLLILFEEHSATV